MGTALMPQGSAQAIAVRQELDVADVIAQVKKIQLIMAEVMVKSDPERGIEGHYGVIPGTQKPTLLQAGADKLMLTFRLDPQFQLERQWDGKHLTVYSTCVLWHIPSGLRYGSGSGSCSTKESKYAYRKGGRVCPECGKDTIIKGKAEYGGGWLCFGKKGGCGSKWKDGDAAIESQSTDRVPNEDLADQYNTVEKMANKRSKIAAVLNVTAASDIFTQDLEDLGDTGGAPAGAKDRAVRTEVTVAPQQPIEDPEAHREESELNFPTPEEQERLALIKRIQIAGAKLTKTQRGKLKEVFLGDAEADITKGDVAALKALAAHVEESAAK